MKRILLLLLLFGNSAFAQNSFKAIVKDEKTGELLFGVSVYIPALKTGGSTDVEGKVTINNLPDSTYEIVFSYVGYTKKTITINFPQKEPDQWNVIELEPSNLELEGVTVSTTRTNSRIEDVPVRLEVIGEEEISEKGNMKPGNISMLLSESSGIQTQQTSATSGNVQIRIQGLDGKYTQILKDGFPLYSGFSSGLSIMQIPPLDLKQVELIKGSSSALYGGDAIAGIINLVSKTPGEKPEWSMICSQTHKLGTDFGTFYSGRKNKLGFTFLASGSLQQPFDVNRDGFTDLPKLQQVTLNPRLFYYFNDSTTLMFGFNTSFESRTGGDIFAIRNGVDSTHAFIEASKSNRNYSQLKFEKIFRNGNVFTAKNSVNYFNRSISRPSSVFEGNQVSSYSEISWLLKFNRHTTVAGLNFISDAFRENRNLNPSANRDYTFYTGGLFIQDDWKIGERFTLQTGIRTDYQNQYGLFVLPRFSAMYKFNDHWTARTGAGLGYKTPTIFDANSEQEGFNNVLPINANVNAETSRGMNCDVNYRTVFFDELSFAVNQAFYYTQVYHSLIPDSDSLLAGKYYLQNAEKPIDTRGFETNVKLKYKDFKFFIAYTYIDAIKRFDHVNPHVELTPHDKLVLTLVYEKEKNIMVGLEGFYTGQMYLGNGTKSRDYWIMGLMCEKKIGEKFSIIINLENFLDTRQTRYESIIIPPYTNPSFKEIYAPLDGFVGNIAIKIKL